MELKQIAQQQNWKLIHYNYSYSWCSAEYRVRLQACTAEPETKIIAIRVLHVAHRTSFTNYSLTCVNGCVRVFVLNNFISCWNAFLFIFVQPPEPDMHNTWLYRFFSFLSLRIISRQYQFFVVSAKCVLLCLLFEFHNDLHFYFAQSVK